ncbi:MAG: hypothetical protein ABIJ46_04500 [bacterium]
MSSKAGTDRAFYVGIRLAAALAVLAIFARALAAVVTPDGYLTVTTDLKSPSAFVSEPKPSNRLDLESGPPFRLLDDPLYLDLRPPSEFRTVTVRVEYLNRGQSSVEIGALANRLDGQFELRPVESRLVEALNWSRLSSGRLVLLQRNRRYSTLDEFLSSPPPPERVATCRVGLDWPYRPDGYVPLDEPKVRRVSLRGHHRLLTYTAGEMLSFSFVVQDMNRQDGADPVTLSVYREGSETAVARTVLQDDGNTSDDQRSSALRTVAVSVSGPEPGLYRVEFTAPDDVFIRELTSRQPKFVFLGRLYLGDHIGYSDLIPPVEVLAGGNALTVRTAHAEGLQTIRVDGRSFEVQEPNVRQDVRLARDGRAIPIVSPRRDLLLETDGVFALEPDDFFRPLPTEIDWRLTSGDLDAAGIDYLLTEYEPPVRDGELTVATTAFDLDQLALTDDGAYRFAVSAPGIALSANDLRIKSVSFVLRRDRSGWADGLRRLWRETFSPEPVRDTSVILPHGGSFGEEVR